jgi:hypothetical protein
MSRAGPGAGFRLRCNTGTPSSHPAARLKARKSGAHAVTGSTAQSNSSPGVSLASVLVAENPAGWSHARGRRHLGPQRSAGAQERAHEAGPGAKPPAGRLRVGRAPHRRLRQAPSARSATNGASLLVCVRRSATSAATADGADELQWAHRSAALRAHAAGGSVTLRNRVGNGRSAAWGRPARPSHGRRRGLRRPSSARTGACPRVTGQGIGADGAGLVLRKTMTGAGVRLRPWER